MVQYPSVSQPYVRYFKNSAGSMAMNVDGSVTPVNFDLNHGMAIDLYTLTIHLVDIGVVPSEFGGLGDALGNGIRFIMLDPNGREVFDFLQGGKIDSNAEFAHLGGSATFITNAATDDLLVCRVTATDWGGPLRLLPHFTLRFIIRDDLTDLTQFEAFILGRHLW